MVEALTGERKQERVSYPSLVDVDALKALLDGSEGGKRERIRALLNQPEFALRDFGSTEEHRAQVLAWCEALAKEEVGAGLFPVEFGGTGDLAGFLASFEMLAYHSISLTIKFGVQYGLWGGSVYQLGTERHHRKYLPDTVSLKLAGCFAMTEIGHGSNVRGIETEAVYDVETGEFVIDSPSYSAGKIYIGNAARDGKVATVFAQLEIGEERKGVHAFVVPIRDEEGDVLPGVRIEDCGEKVGLNGVDNGMIWFDGVRVPRENLLNRFADVDEEGKWTSPIESESARFFTMLGTLVGGRMSIAGCGVNAAKTGLTIAMRYALERRQFGRAGEEEMLLLDYPTHQRRLIGGLASLYGLHFAVQELVASHAANGGKPTREVETHAAALKAYATWQSHALLQTCREACGGEGYLSKNRLGELKADVDIFTTFEGDNTVLMQLVAKGLLGELKQKFKKGEMSLIKVLQKRWASGLRQGLGRRVDFTDVQQLQVLMREREELQLLALGRRMMRSRKAGADGMDSLLDNQLDMVRVAEAHAERVVLDAFCRGLADATGENREVLGKLALVFAIERVLKDGGWFGARGVTRKGFLDARRELGILYREIRVVAGELVDAFGVPESCLAGTIGESSFRIRR